MAKKKKASAESREELREELKSELRSQFQKETITLAVLALVLGFIAGILVANVFKGQKAPSLPSPQVSLPPSGPLAKAGLEGEINRLKEIVATNPKNYEAWVQLGNTYYDSEQSQLAIEAYEKALAINSSDPNVLTDIGTMYLRAGQIDKAVEAFQKAMAMDATHANSRFNLGIVLKENKNDFQGAIKAWEEYLKLAPQGPHADFVRDGIKEMRDILSLSQEGKDNP